MPRIEETQLPGVGLRHDLTTRAGDRLGVITHRTGRRELLLYDRRDPDSCRDVVRLDEDEGHALAEVLGGTKVAESLDNMIQQSVEGLTIDWLPATASWSCAGHTVAETMLRARTGVSIVAIVRGVQTVPSPTPDFRIEAGDTLVVVGTPEAIKSAFTHLESGVGT
ncbi:MAG TPA: cation:proton antiporter regulatory subunit [Egibacteraceae bacterium]|nr:cation:proton antiporter regulatory subunit [Egibacteraceae bacterium]